MNSAIKSANTLASGTLALMFACSCVAQGTIVYSGFVVQSLGDGMVDFDGDGTDEFTFSSTHQTTGINPEFHTGTYLIGSASHSALAFDGGSLQLVSAGTSIGSSLTPEWGGTSEVLSLLTISYLVPTPLPDPNYPGQNPTWPQYGGPLADAGGLAYLAARWELADGLHYGWIRVSSQGISHPDNPYLIYLGPLVADWAYNAAPNEPILAGAVPEPSVLTLLLGGGVLLVLFWRKQTNRMSEQSPSRPRCSACQFLNMH